MAIPLRHMIALFTYRNTWQVIHAFDIGCKPITVSKSLGSFFFKLKLSTPTVSAFLDRADQHFNLNTELFFDSNQKYHHYCRGIQSLVRLCRCQTKGHYLGSEILFKGSKIVPGGL